MTEFFLTGDNPFFSALQLKSLSWLPSVWHEEGGLGLTDISRLWIEYPFRLIVKVLSVCGFSWFVIEKIFWSACFFLACIGIYRLLRLYGIPKLFSIVGGFFYICNTYVLLLVGGGQLGVCFGYVAIPWIIYGIQKGYRGPGIEKISCAVIIGFSMMADIRLALLGILAGCFIAFFSSWSVHEKGIVKNSAILLGTIAIIIIPMHAFWIIPLILYPDVTLGNAYITGGMAQFLSFADFSHALSLLHPNWPENLFGKVYFMQPEFLILPLLAFGGLLFYEKSKMSKRNKGDLYFFALLGLLGAFLAKGANPPFGEIYLWCINHIPGFVLFRDPTKFYAVIGCAYAFLLASTGMYVASLATKRRRLVRFGVAGAIVVICILLVRDVFQGTIIRFIPISDEYIKLEKMFIQEQRFFRTLWIPTKETFSPIGNTIPIVTPEMIFHESSPSAIARIFNDETVGQKLGQIGIQYVVIIPDERRSQYLTDYSFNPSIKNEYIRAIEQNSSFEKNPEFLYLQVFRNKVISGSLLSIGTGPLSYEHPENGTYRVVTEGTPEKLQFLFQYDPYWQVTDGMITRKSQKDTDGFMVFDVGGMSNSLTLQYLPEQVSRMIAPWSLGFIVLISSISFVLSGKKRT
jgi:hypothetical protein